MNKATANPKDTVEAFAGIQVGPLQLRVLNVLWGAPEGRGTVQFVHATLNAQKGSPTLAYTTILTVMRNLARRHLLDQIKGPRQHIFATVLDRDAYMGRAAKSFVSDYFGGDKDALLEAIR